MRNGPGGGAPRSESRQFIAAAARGVAASGGDGWQPAACDGVSRRCALLPYVSRRTTLLPFWPSILTLLPNSHTGNFLNFLHLIF